MKNSLYFVSGLISIIIISLTGWIAFNSNISILHDLCFNLHLIPFGIGFSGGSALSIIIYYSILWIVLTMLIIPIVEIYYSAKNKGLILISTISICILGLGSIIWVEYSIKKEQEERISQNENEDKRNFDYLKSGDIILQTSCNLSNDSKVHPSSLNNKLAIIDVDIHGYTVLEITDRVQYASLRSWIKKNANYIVKRLVNADSVLTEESIEKLREERQKFIFKPYDYSHCWSDDTIYDSELIWKIYKRALNIELGTLEVSKNSHENMHEQEKCIDKYVVSPMIIINSDKLITVKKN